MKSTGLVVGLVAAWLALCGSYISAAGVGVPIISCANQETPATTLPGKVKERRRFYEKHFPELCFLVLSGGENWSEELVVLSVFLGNKPSSLDYEHPPDLREDLMFASWKRLELMLQNNIPSATLFKADEPLGWKEKVCVITLNPDVIAGSDIASTKHLLGESPFYDQSIPENRLLNHEDYLEYVFDHEVYHCLYSAFVSPQAMSDKSVWGEYQAHRNEQGADAFAMLMHMRKKGRVTELSENIKIIRGLSFLGDDCGHWTYDTLAKVLQLPVEKYRSLSPRQTLHMATQFRNDYQPLYTDYLSFLVAVKDSMLKMGILVLFKDSIEKEIRGKSADSYLADKYHRLSKENYKKFWGKEFQQ